MDKGSSDSRVDIRDLRMLTTKDRISQILELTLRADHDRNHSQLGRICDDSIKPQLSVRIEGSKEVYSPLCLMQINRLDNIDLRSRKSTAVARNSALWLERDYVQSSSLRDVLKIIRCCQIISDEAQKLGRMLENEVKCVLPNFEIGIG